MAVGFFKKLKKVAKKVVQAAPKVLNTASKVVGTFNPAAGAALGTAAKGINALKSGDLNTAAQLGGSLLSQLRKR